MYRYIFCNFNIILFLYLKHFNICTTKLIKYLTSWNKRRDHSVQQSSPYFFLPLKRKWCIQAENGHIGFKFLTIQFLKADDLNIYIYQHFNVSRLQSPIRELGSCTPSFKRNLFASKNKRPHAKKMFSRENTNYLMRYKQSEQRWLIQIACQRIRTNVKALPSNEIYNNKSRRSCARVWASVYSCRFRRRSVHTHTRKHSTYLKYL